MRQFFSHFFRSLLFITFLFASNAYADPPNRVGRISYIHGIVSFSSTVGRNNVWVPAKINYPLITGDRIWADSRARAELQIGNASLRIEDKTSIRILNLNDLIAQFDLSQGTVALNVRRLSAGHVYEIDTPQLAFKVTQPGSFRIDVTDAGDATIVTVRSGKGIVYTRNGAYKIKSAGTYRYAENNFHHVSFYSEDNFDRWSSERERRSTRSRSASYVSTTLIGYEDLDTYGSWRNVQGYGNVWIPNNVSSNWAPYRHGNWSWVEPWGWTWIDDEPWGFATSHYGRWAYYKNNWVWIPGHKNARATYAPALVAFIGGNGFQINVSIGGSDSGIAWIPLGPRDVYVPPYAVTEQYFTNINVSNTTISQTNITNVYNNPASLPAYTYHEAPYAVTAVPKKTFTESKPVAPAVVPMSNTNINQAPPSTTTTATVPQPETAAPPTTTAAKPSDNTLGRVPVVVTPPPPSTTADGTGKPVDIMPVTPVEQVTPPSEATIPDAATKPEKSEDKVPDAPPPSDKAAPGKTVEPVNDKKEIEPAVIVPPDAVPAPTDKAVLDHAAAAKAEADKAEMERAAAAAKTEQDKAATEKAQADQTAADAKADAARDTAAKAEADRAAASAQAQADKAAAEKAEADRSAATKAAEAERETAERAQADKAAAQAQAEAQRAAVKKAESERASSAAQAEADRADRADRAAKQAEAEQAADANSAAPTAAPASTTAP